MKKIAFIGVALSLLLTGCSLQPLTGDGTQTQNGEGTGQIQAPQSTPQAPQTQASQQLQTPTSPEDQIALDAMQTRLDYYEDLVKDLEEELLTLRSEWYMERISYESRIEALKAQLSGKTEATTQGSGTQTGSNQPVPLPFTYEKKDGKVSILTYTGSSTSVTVPSQIDGLPVSSIADRAFENKTKLRSVTLPEGLEEIGWFAFSGCVALESVTLPASVKSIAYGAFENCNAALVVYAPVSSYAAAYAQSYGIRTVVG